MQRIHPSAILGDAVQLGEDVEIGPYCVLEGAIEIKQGTKLLSHVVIKGRCVIGEQCEVHPFAALGGDPQDLTYQNEPTSLRIGDNTIIREGANVHRGTARGRGETAIGNDCLIMSAAHIGHDCVLGDNTVLCSNAILGGHCHIGEYAFLGGGVGCRQHVHIGEHTYIGGLTGVNDDVPPFLTAFGVPAELIGVNIVGLRRRGFARDAINQLRHLFRQIFYSDMPFVKALEEAEKNLPDCAEARRLATFLRERREAGHAPLRPRRGT